MVNKVRSMWGIMGFYEWEFNVNIYIVWVTFMILIEYINILV